MSFFNMKKININRLLTLKGNNTMEVSNVIKEIVSKIRSISRSVIQDDMYNLDK